MGTSETTPGIGPEGRFWKGPDVETLKEVTIPPLGVCIVPVALSEQMRQVLEDSLVWRPGSKWRVSVRSRFAQAGLDIDPLLVGRRINISLFQVPAQDSSVIQIPITNHAPRPAQLLQGTQLFRFFVDPGMDCIKGEELIGFFRNGGFRTGGGKLYFRADGENQEETGVFIPIDPESRRRISPDSQEPIVVDGQMTDYRKFLERFLLPLTFSSRQEDCFWIGETVHLTLPFGVDAIIDGVVRIDKEGRIRRESGRHTNSRLIDGRTDWGIRVEVVSSIAAQRIPNYLALRFVKAG